MTTVDAPIDTRLLWRGDLVREAEAHAQRAAAATAAARGFAKTAKAELDAFAPKHALTLQAAREGVDRLAVAARHDLDAALRRTLPRLCSPNLLLAGVDEREQAPAAAGITPRLGTVVGMPDDRPAPPAGRHQLLALAAAVAHVDRLHERLDAHPEWFSTLTSTEVAERLARARVHVVVAERHASAADGHAEHADGAAAGARVRSKELDRRIRLEAHYKREVAPEQLAADEAAMTSGVSTAEQAADNAEAARDNAEHALQAVRAALAGDAAPTTTKPARARAANSKEK
jgi:hypothetical protein